MGEPHKGGGTRPLLGRTYPVWQGNSPTTGYSSHTMAPRVVGGFGVKVSAYLLARPVGIAKPGLTESTGRSRIEGNAKRKVCSRVAVVLYRSKSEVKPSCSSVSLSRARMSLHIELCLGPSRLEVPDWARNTSLYPGCI